MTGCDKGMWVKEQNKGENKEKCVNGAIVPDSEAITVGQVWYIRNPNDNKAGDFYISYLELYIKEGS